MLKRNPKNEKALFQNSFCQRALGQNKDAIEGLTKILAVAQRVQNEVARGIVDPHYHMAVPLDTVYGTRGTSLSLLGASIASFYCLSLLSLYPLVRISPLPLC